MKKKTSIILINSYLKKKFYLLYKIIYIAFIINIYIFMYDVYDVFNNLYFSVIFYILVKWRGYKIWHSSLKNKKLKADNLFAIRINGSRLTDGDIKILSLLSMMMVLFILLVTDINFLGKKCLNLNNGLKLLLALMLIWR